MVTSAAKLFCRGHFARIFTLKSVGQFLHELHAGKIFCSGVSKIADFRHVDREEKAGWMFPAGDDFGRLWYTAEISLLNISGGGGTCLDFYIEGQRTIWTR